MKSKKACDHGKSVWVDTSLLSGVEDCGGGGEGGGLSIAIVSGMHAASAFGRGFAGMFGRLPQLYFATDLRSCLPSGRQGKELADLKRIDITTDGGAGAGREGISTLSSAEAPSSPS